VELYESVRSKSKSSLSSSFASRIVWLIRKKAATNETIAVNVFFRVIFVLGDAESGKVCWVPAKEWMTRAPVRPALAALPSFEVVAPFPEAVALSS